VAKVQGFLSRRGFRCPPIAGAAGVSQKGRRFLRGRRRRERTVVKSHEIASQNSFSIPSSQNFAYTRILSGG
jgi:hypothetical protein